MKKELEVKPVSNPKKGDRVWSKYMGLGTISWLNLSWPGQAGVIFDRTKEERLRKDWILEETVLIDSLYNASKITEDTESVKIVYKLK